MFCYCCYDLFNKWVHMDEGRSCLLVVGCSFVGQIRSLRFFVREYATVTLFIWKRPPWRLRMPVLYAWLCWSFVLKMASYVLRICCLDMSLGWYGICRYRCLVLSDESSIFWFCLKEDVCCLLWIVEMLSWKMGSMLFCEWPLLRRRLYNFWIFSIRSFQ